MPSADNKVTVQSPVIKRNRILYSFRLEGPWKEAFRAESLEIEYSMGVSAVPEGVAVIPLLANILPIAWLYSAEVSVPVCDADFFECISDVKRGYENMYPMMRFGGGLEAGRLEDNPGNRGGSVCFFSGGVDAFDTLIRHVEEHPLLLTLRGADVSLDDDEGWNRVRGHIEEVGKDFGIGWLTVESTFRGFLDYDVLNSKVTLSGDDWWHGFQHGLGLIGHAAPIAYLLGKETVYIASSFTAEDVGATCASDPSIDNYVRFCGARVMHDGYECSRQDKARNIVRFSCETGTPVKLRVCWESDGGSNCCTCEKCGRTILELMAEDADPRDFGFEYTHQKFNYLMRKLHYYLIIRYPHFYCDIARAARENGVELPTSARWVFSPRIDRICTNRRKWFLNRVYGALWRLSSRVRRDGE